MSAPALSSPARFGAIDQAYSLERVENKDSGKLAYGILRGQLRAARPLAPQVERTFSWMACCRRLVVRYEPRADIHKAFLQLRAS